MKPDGRKRNLLAGFCSALFLFAIPCVVLAEESDYGYVSITTDARDAVLYVDGAYAGKLPMSDTLKLPVGKHLLSFLSGSRTSKLYPIGDDVPTLITTTKETEVEYPGFHVHVTFGGGGITSDLDKNDKSDNDVDNGVSTDIKKDNDESNVDKDVSNDTKKDESDNRVDQNVSTDLSKDQDKDKDNDKDKDKDDKDNDNDRDRDRDRDNDDRDRDRDRDHDRGRDRDRYRGHYYGPEKVVTTTTSTTEPNVSYNERRIIESASYWVYVQSEGTTPVYMDYSEYTGTVDKINQEARRRNQLFWGCVGGGAALVGVVVILAVMSQ